MVPSFGQKATSGAIWASVDRFSNMGLQFIVNLILARLLEPDDFGAIGMLAIFISVSQILIDGGFNSALIQKKEPTQADYSTVFYWNLGFALSLYIILFLCAPLISRFFKLPALSGMLRLIGCNLILSSIISIQTTRLKKDLSFKLIAITNISSYILSSCIAIYMAYTGFGAWSLVVMQICNSLLNIIMLWVITRWHPSLIFSKKTIKELFNFGGYIMAASLLQVICQNIQGLIIGKKFSATQVGYYSQAYKLDQVTSYSIPQVIVQVMFPVYSTIQDNLKKLANVLSLNIRVISFIIFPILGLLILISEPLISYLYGEKWLPSVPYFQILCVGGLFLCLQNINFYAVAAIGKSQKLFIWSFYKWGFLLFAIIFGAKLGIYGILWSMVASSINVYVVNAYLVAKYIGLKLYKQLLIILPSFLSVLFSLACSYLIKEHTNSGLTTCLLTYVFIFSIVSLCTNKKSIHDTKYIINKLLRRSRDEIS